MLLGTTVLGHFFHRLFGMSYGAGYWLLVLCMGGRVIRAISGMNLNLLTIHGQQTQTAVAAVMGIAIFIFAAILLAAPFGVTGVGYAVLIVEIAGGLMLAPQARDLTSKRADLLWLLSHSR